MLDDIDVKGSEPQLTRKCLWSQCYKRNAQQLIQYVSHDSSGTIQLIVLLSIYNMFEFIFSANIYVG